MFNSYNDAQLMNESFNFYTATNTFKNPAFTCWPDNNLAAAAAAAGHLHVQHGADDQLRRPSDDDDDLERREARGSAAAAAGASGSSMQESASGSLDSSSGPTTRREKLIDFCDSLAFNLKGKAFIMETNFKRRLRGAKRFLSERLLPCIAPCYRGVIDDDDDDDDANKHSSASRGHRERRPSECSTRVTGRNLRRLIRREQREHPRGPPECSEPTSARSLGVQQDRILSRLERIKRDSQKLFSIQHAPGRITAMAWDHASEPRHRSLGGPVSLPLWLSSSSGRAVVAASESLSDIAKTDDELGRASWSEMTSSEQASMSKRAKVAKTTAGRWAAISGGTQQMKQAAIYALSYQPKKTCIVCYERAPNIATLPCEHADICSDCFIEIIYLAVKNSQYPLRCVLCRQKVERIRCSRRLMLSVIKRNRASSKKQSGVGGAKVRPALAPF